MVTDKTTDFVYIGNHLWIFLFRLEIDPWISTFFLQKISSGETAVDTRKLNSSGERNVWITV